MRPLASHLARSKFAAWLRAPGGWLAASLIAFVAVFQAWLLAVWAGADLGAEASRLISDVVAIVVGLAAAGYAWRTACHPGLSPATRRAWGFVALAEVGYTVGSVLWMYYDLGGERPFPSLADAGYMTLYPFLMAALLSFPLAPRSATDRWKFWLDAALVLVGSGTLVWYFILLPVVIASDASDPLTLGLSLAYPVLDLVLLAGLMSILARQPERGSRAALGLFVGGLSLFVAADLVYGYLEVQAAYQSGSPLDGLWIIGLLLMLLGAHHQRVTASAPAEPAATADRGGWGAWWVPYTAVGAAYGLLLLLMQDQWSQPQGGVLLGAVALTGLVVARQAGSQQEHARLYQAARAELRHRQQIEALLAHQATHDALTGLPNRRLLHERLAALLGATGQTQPPFALLLLDLDRFKEVNDTLGHPIGDELLGIVARRLQGATRPDDTVARMGGDEFAVLLAGADAATAAQAAARLLADLSAPVVLGGQRLPVSGSVGIAVYPEHGSEASELLRRADGAMYTAKRSGTGYALASPEPAARAS